MAIVQKKGLTLTDSTGADASNSVALFATDGGGNIIGLKTLAGVTVSGITSYTLAQFLAPLNPALYAGRDINISDIPTPHCSSNGVRLRGNDAGTGWIWLQTPSFTTANVPRAAQAVGMGRIFISDIGNRGSYWYSDGTRFKLDQPSVVLSNITASLVLAASSATATIAKQVAIPLLQGKSIWNDGDILVINQYAEKTGTADIIHTAAYIGQNAHVIDDPESGGTANTLISTQPATVATSLGISMVRRLLRKSDTSVRLLESENIAPDGGLSGTKSVDVTISSLDTATSYVDATIRVSAVTTDTALTLAGHTVTLVAAGAA